MRSKSMTAGFLFGYRLPGFAPVQNRLRRNFTALDFTFRRRTVPSNTTEKTANMGH
jgi:hypothetical protein